MAAREKQDETWSTFLLLNGEPGRKAKSNKKRTVWIVWNLEELLTTPSREFYDAAKKIFCCHESSLLFDPPPLLLARLVGRASDIEGLRCALHPLLTQSITLSGEIDTSFGLYVSYCG